MMKVHQRFRRKITDARSLVLAAVAAAATVFATAFSAENSVAAELKILSTANAAIRGALTELAPRFEKSTGHRITVEYASALPLKRRIDAGGTFDVVIAPALVDDLIKQGKVAAPTRATLARTGLGVGVPKGAPKPDIGSVEAFRRTLRDAKSIGYEPESQPGLLFLEVLDHLGAQDLRLSLKAYRATESLAAALETRDVEIVVSSIANLASVTDSVVEFPPDLQQHIEFAIGVSAATREPEAASALVTFLVSPAVAPVFKARGLQRD
jgi:molybdate transport system substrate-binding protein